MAKHLTVALLVSGLVFSDRDGPCRAEKARPSREA